MELYTSHKSQRHFEKNDSFFKLTKTSLIEDFKSPLSDMLSRFYIAEKRQRNLLATLINSIFTERKTTFSLTASLLNQLIQSDKNVNAKYHMTESGFEVFIEHLLDQKVLVYSRYQNSLFELHHQQMIALFDSWFPGHRLHPFDEQDSNSATLKVSRHSSDQQLDDFINRRQLILQIKLHSHHFCLENPNPNDWQLMYNQTPIAFLRLKNELIEISGPETKLCKDVVKLCFRT